MIPKLKKFTQRIEAIDNTLMVGFVTSSMEENKAIFEDLVTGQLSEGKDGDGDDLLQYQSDEYAAFKKSIGSKSSPVADLKLTGAYHRSIMLETTKKSASIVSRDEKDAELTFKYGDAIKQLDEESKKEGRLQIKPDIQEQINKFIFTK